MTRTKLRASLTEQAPCRCGSGLHPRRCVVHPHEYQRHCDEISIESLHEQLAESYEQAAQLVEREACTVCAKADVADAPILGHAECWRLVKLAREIRRLGMQRDANP